MDRQPYIEKWITALYRNGHSYFDYRAEEYGIGSSCIFFLLCLYQQQGSSQDAISKILNVDKATTSRIGATLERRGYVTRQQDLKDRRAYEVFLTEEGRKLEPKIRLIVEEWSQIVTKDFTGEEEKIAYQLLQRMADKAIDAKNDHWATVSKFYKEK